ncbi:hypothetical protein PVAP13_2NG428703 [Panicum virgatum]|uniref:Uncharacterized protein n=1 Tax=Panicum virgatum TaxID=38727 RepID=A0A8T0VSG2_PANVG|nr:hypothetical protein PVAP13_2NG428703 [Panicum virgatum]
MVSEQVGLGIPHPTRDPLFRRPSAVADPRAAGRHLPVLQPPVVARVRGWPVAALSHPRRCSSPPPPPAVFILAPSRCQSRPRPSAPSAPPGRRPPPPTTGHSRYSSSSLRASVRVRLRLSAAVAAPASSAAARAPVAGLRPVLCFSSQREQPVLVLCCCSAGAAQPLLSSAGAGVVRLCSARGLQKGKEGQRLPQFF